MICKNNSVSELQAKVCYNLMTMCDIISFPEDLIQLGGKYLVWCFFLLINFIQTGSGAHPATYPVGVRDRAAGAWSWSPTSI